MRLQVNIIMMTWKSWLCKYLTYDHVGNLNDRIHFGLRKDTFPPGTFDVIAQNAKRSYIRPFPFRSMWNKCIPSDIDLKIRLEKNSWKSIDYTYACNGLTNFEYTYVKWKTHFNLTASFLVAWNNVGAD